MELGLKEKVDAVVTPVLKRKVAAWWYGVDEDTLDWPEEVLPEEGDQGGALAVEEEADPTKAAYDLNHFMIVSQALWGEGFVSPGGVQFIDEWGPQISLNKEKSSLFLGSGLGGQAREISKSMGSWVVGYERAVELVDAATEQANMAGMSRNSTSEVYNPETIELPEEKYHAVLAKEEFTFVQDKARLLEQISGSLVSGGMVMFTEYVSTGDVLSAGKVDALFGSLHGRPLLWSEQDYISKLEDCGLDVHVNEDFSDRYVEFISTGWQRYREIVNTIREGEESDLDKARLLHFVADSAEHWTQVVEALGSRELQVRRFLARKA